MHRRDSASILLLPVAAPPPPSHTLSFLSSFQYPTEDVLVSESGDNAYCFSTCFWLSLRYNTHAAAYS